MTIVLLEDMPEHQKLFAAALKHFEQRQDTQFTLHVFDSIDAYCADSVAADILFLDIDLGDETDGIAFGKQLRARGEDAAIIIVTAFDDRHRDAIKAGITRYLEKPYTQEEFDEAMIAAIRGLQSKRYVIEIAFGGKKRFLKIYDIVYIENYKKQRLIHLADGSVLETTSTWDHIRGQLPDVLFCFIQKNLLLNLHNLKSSTANVVTVSTEETLNIARSAKQNFKLAYDRYVEVLTWEASYMS